MLHSTFTKASVILFGFFWAIHPLHDRLDSAKQRSPTVLQQKGKVIAIEVDTSVLQRWIRNFRENKDQPTITRSALLKLIDLKTTLTDMESKYGSTLDGFRLYFVRFGAEDVRQIASVYKFTPDSQFTQVSIVLVPTRNYRVGGPGGLWADDFPISKRTILVIPLGHPDIFNEGTGLCPPNCGGGFGYP